MTNANFKNDLLLFISTSPKKINVENPAIKPYGVIFILYNLIFFFYFII